MAYNKAKEEYRWNQWKTEEEEEAAVAMSGLAIDNVALIVAGALVGLGVFKN